MLGSLERAIVIHMRRVYGIAIGGQMIEELRGSLTVKDAIEVRGRDLESALPRKVTVVAREIREAIRQGIGK
jgi:actin-like ATPase involved in cell morphogenesis